MIAGGRTLGVRRAPKVRHNKPAGRERPDCASQTGQQLKYYELSEVCVLWCSTHIINYKLGGDLVKVHIRLDWRSVSRPTSSVTTTDIVAEYQQLHTAALMKISRYRAHGDKLMFQCSSQRWDSMSRESPPRMAPSPPPPDTDSNRHPHTSNPGGKSLPPHHPSRNIVSAPHRRALPNGVAMRAATRPKKA